MRGERAGLRKFCVFVKVVGCAYIRPDVCAEPLVLPATATEQLPSLRCAPPACVNRLVRW
jgi:hypothetical protein